MATPCGCTDGDYRPECWNCDDQQGGGPNGPACPSTHYRDPNTGQCIRISGSEPPSGVLNCPPGQHPEISYACPQGCCKSNEGRTTGSGGTTQQSTVPRANYAGVPIDYSKFLTRTSQETQALQGISDLARLLSGWGSGLYGVGMPAYAQALDYYRALLGPSKAAATRAIAPQGELISEVYKGADRELDTLPRGGAQDTARAELMRSKAGQIGALIPQAQQGAAAAAGSLGLSGVQTGGSFQGQSASMLGGVVEAEQSNRLAGLGAALQDKSLDLQRLLGLRGQDIQEMLGLKNIELGYSGLDVQRDQLSQQNSQFQQTFGMQQQYFDWYRQFQQQQLQQQRRQSQGQKYGQLLGTALTIGSQFIPVPGAGTAGAVAGGAVSRRSSQKLILMGLMLLGGGA